MNPEKGVERSPRASPRRAGAGPNPEKGVESEIGHIHLITPLFRIPKRELKDLLAKLPDVFTPQRIPKRELKGWYACD